MSYRNAFDQISRAMGVAGGLGALTLLVECGWSTLPASRHANGEKLLNDTNISFRRWLDARSEDLYVLRSWRDRITQSQPEREPNMTLTGAVRHRQRKMYDFIIVGAGSAGSSALKTLQKECPFAKIAIVDPLHRPSSCGVGTVDVYPDHASRLDPRQRVVSLGPSDGSCGAIKYRYAVLIATGTRGAPPPSYLMDAESCPSIMELRPTTYTASYRPRLTMEDVRRTALRVVKDSGKLVVLGSGFDALDLVVAASACTNARSSRPTIMFGNSSPVSSCLPSYLSSALMKRLKHRKINVQDRTLVRYISSAHSDSNSDHERLHIYTAKSYDFLDSAITGADLVVVASDTRGSCGCAAIATTEIPPPLRETAKDRAWFQTWANLSRESADAPALISCYKDDGRIAVNTELCACSGVYAAGSVAKYANGLTGHAEVPDGFVGAVASGHVASLNMSRQYGDSNVKNMLQRQLQNRMDRSEEHTSSVAVAEAIPVWRSDIRSLRSDSDSALSFEKTSLHRIGIDALCVGNCDSKIFATHGVWWTNHASQRRLQNLAHEDHHELPRRNTVRRRRAGESLTPVYGIGVVYYLDRSGKIQGIMTWGLPFTERDTTALNPRLVKQLKEVIVSNGGLRSLRTEQDHLRMTEYLSQEARRAAYLSFRGTTTKKPDQFLTDSQKLYELIDELPKPLHRFTESRPANLRSLNVLKRNDGQGHGVLGQDLFDRYDDSSVEDAPIPRPNMAENVGFAARKAESMYEWYVWEQKEKRWDENESRGRPAQEDSIWIRKGDETRNISSKDTTMAAFASIMYGKNAKQ